MLSLRQRRSPRSHRERTGADQLAQTQIETIRTLAYTQVGIGRRQPARRPGGEHLDDPPLGRGGDRHDEGHVGRRSGPGSRTSTNADYKKVVLTSRATATASSSRRRRRTSRRRRRRRLPARRWVQIKRTVLDAVKADAHGGRERAISPAGRARRTAPTRPTPRAPCSSLRSTAARTALPVYTLATTLHGLQRLPGRHLAREPHRRSRRRRASARRASSGCTSPTSLTVNLQNSSGAPYTGGATISLDSSRCGVQPAAMNIPSGQSSITFTTCNYATGKTVPLPPNVLGQTPLDDKYYVTAWSNSGDLWSSGTAVSVPSSYPTTLTQSVTVKFGSTVLPRRRRSTVTVTKGGSNDTNARVEVTGGPAGVNLYGDDGRRGTASFTIPVTGTATTYTVYANDMGAAARTGRRLRASLEQRVLADLDHGADQLRRILQTGLHRREDGLHARRARGRDADHAGRDGRPRDHADHDLALERPDTGADDAADRGALRREHARERRSAARSSATGRARSSRRPPPPSPSTRRTSTRRRSTAARSRRSTCRRSRTT